jgi:hypothetical protein
MKRRPIAWALVCGFAAAPAVAQQPSALPSCRDLIPALAADPSSARNRIKLQTIDHIVEDRASTGEGRLCTGVARYRNDTAHLTFSAKWDDAKRKTMTVIGHETVDSEEASRALSLRRLYHPSGADGSYSLQAYVPYCTDAEFIKIATAEMHYGISFRTAFYREPDFEIIDITANGYGSGILSNCVATVGNDKEKGTIFLGTNWVSGGEKERRYEFYILESGPDGFKLKNRLWELGEE